jgi:peptidoglycan/LPS O-acetylase OafA/YrhL
MRYLGRISYSIYLYQQLTVGIANKFTAHYPDYGSIGGDGGVNDTGRVSVLLHRGALLPFAESPFRKLPRIHF